MDFSRGVSHQLYYGYDMIDKQWSVDLMVDQLFHGFFSLGDWDFSRGTLKMAQLLGTFFHWGYCYCDTNQSYLIICVEIGSIHIYI